MNGTAPATLLAGASGLTGREVLRCWAVDGQPALGPLHALLRRAPAFDLHGHAVLTVDFIALPALPPCTAAICCLGTTIKTAGSQAAFKAVDFDAVLAFARAAQAAGATRFAAVSALGANARSSNFYSRTKGEVEAALRELGFECLVIARPSLLRGDRPALGQATRPGERIGLAVTAVMGGLIPLALRPIEAATVARALCRALAAPHPAGASAAVAALSSAALQQLGAPAAPLAQGRPGPA